MSLREPSEMARMVVSYSVLRLGLFAVAFIVLLFTPLPRLAAFAIALVVSAVLSYPLGRQQRERMAVLLGERRGSKPVR